MPFKTEIKKVKQEVITECTCDRCGVVVCFPDKYGSAVRYKDTIDQAGVSGFILKHTGGYYSKYDCKTGTLVLCDDCFFELVKEIKSKK